MENRNAVTSNFEQFEQRRVFRWIEKVHPALLIFVLLLLNRISFMLNGGEEHYLSFALQYFNPQWLPGSFTYTEFPGSRLLFQTITGFFVDQFGFHATAFTGRLLVFLLISFPLARIFRHFSLSNLMMLVIIQLFLQTKQSFFADEWIFWGFEPKAPAYIFLFWGLYFFLEKRYQGMAIALAVSTWFHLLVGGWFVMGVFVVMLLNKVSWKELFRSGLLYGAMMLPLIIYLWPLLQGDYTGPEGVNLKQIYCYLRLKHHIGLFDTYQYFISKHLSGVITAIVVLVLQWFFLRRCEDKSMRRLTQLNIVFLVVALLFVGVAWVDKAFYDRSGGFGLMYYPFRMMGVSLLISIIQGIWLLVRSRKHQVFCKSLLMLAVVASVIILSVRIYLKTNQLVDEIKPDAEMEQLVEAVQQYTAPGDLFILLGQDYPTTTSFSRRTGRDNFVVFKYVPAVPEKLSEWYRRILLEEEMISNANRIIYLAHKEKIQYVITRKRLPETGMRLVWSSKKYYLYDPAPAVIPQIP